MLDTDRDQATPLTAVVQSATRDEANEIFYDVPEKLNPFQWACLSLLWVVVLLLLSFVVYISITWNKYRPNEYA